VLLLHNDMLHGKLEDVTDCSYGNGVELRGEDGHSPQGKETQEPEGEVMRGSEEKGELDLSMQRMAS
jgi:hypothetical protein